VVAHGAAAKRGGDFDRWDLEVRAGILASVRLRAAVEEHGAGRQLIRIGSWPRLHGLGVVGVLVPAALAAVAAITGAGALAAGLAAAAVLIAACALHECGIAASVVRSAGARGS
jgi:hypothetical protein